MYGRTRVGRKSRLSVFNFILYAISQRHVSPSTRPPVVEGTLLMSINLMYII
jgi:hypothetical protein